MYKAKLYNENNNMQHSHALQCLKEYVENITWKSHRVRIIDIGSGDGSLTSTLKKYLPVDCKTLGCDISQSMVQFANKQFGDASTSFTVLNIEGILPDGLQEKFDHVFSFTALHWIKQLEVAYSNIYRLLADGGKCLLMVPGRAPMFDVYRLLALQKKWTISLKDVDKYVSCYHDCQDSQKEIFKMMANIGFTNIDVRYKDMSYKYASANSLKNALEAILPFELSRELLEEFKEDFVQIVRETRQHVTYNIVGAANGFVVTYQSIVISAQKPGSIVK